jgi:hypothetical protein
VEQWRRSTEAEAPLATLEHEVEDVRDGKELGRRAEAGPWTYAPERRGAEPSRREEVAWRGHGRAPARHAQLLLLCGSALLATASFDATTAIWEYSSGDFECVATLEVKFLLIFFRVLCYHIVLLGVLVTRGI